MRRLTGAAAPALAALLAAAVLPAAGAACHSATAPASDRVLRAAAGPRELAVTNVGEGPVFVFVVGRETSALIDWYPCVDAARCPPLASGATRREPRPHTTGGAPERDANVYWWRAVAGAGGALRPDSVRVLTVRFP